MLRQPPDLMLLDLLMPDLSGFEVIEQIRAQVSERWLPILVTSSLPGDAPFIEALRHGADDYLVRPINADLLLAKLGHYSAVLSLQARLTAMAERQRAIHDNILDAVMTFDADGRLQEANRAAMRWFGSPVVPLRGMLCRQVLGADLAELLDSPDVRLQRADGRVFPAELTLGEWREAGRMQHTLVIRDLTERQHIERMKDEFLATVSHELRTPLTSVLGALGLLACGAAGILPKPAMTLTEVARRNGERLSHLIDDILDLSKLEGNRLQLQLRPLKLDALLQEAIAANAGYAQRAGVTLGLVLPAQSALVGVDADRFLQVMANLLSNAIKHSSPGDRVEVLLLSDKDGVRVEVRDQGPGISPEFRPHMFEKFSQADGSDSRAKGGTGLGLYITRMLVERMGGRIGVTSTPGAGACFWVTFSGSEDVTQAARPWLLHVDSDADARARLADWLGPHYALVWAASLAQVQAQEPFAQVQPPIIVADPQAQGSAETFCAALRRRALAGQVILYSDSVDRAFAQHMGLPWLPKTSTTQAQLLSALNDAAALASRKPA
ncbi:MAG: ATP-binding protein [Rhodoferax sp.]